MPRLFQKRYAPRRRKKRAALAPLPPESHAAMVEHKAQARARAKAFRLQWAKDDAAHHADCVLNFERRAAERLALSVLCAREITQPHSSKRQKR